jgi:hypothetical protein
MYSEEKIDKIIENQKTIIDLLLNKENSYSSIPPACRNCSKHPSNGGDGICFCTLGQSKIAC